MKLCDLHIHSVYSDGTWTTAEILAEAKRLDLTVALTDHNTTMGLPEFMAQARELGVTAVAGTELSTAWGKQELHLLGLFLEPKHYAEVEELVEQFHIRKEQSTKDTIARLNDAGYAISYEAVRRRNASGYTNRGLIGAELVDKGYVSSITEAFQTLLGEGMGFYTPPQRPDFLETVRFLRSIEAVPVLAHPLLDLDEAGLRAVLPEAVAAGLVGMEVQHSTYDSEKIALATQIAGEFGLLHSGGSDFHGKNKPDILLAVGKGNLQIPEEYYLALLQAHQKLCTQ